MEHAGPRHVDALRGLVEDQQIGPVDQRAGDQQALEFAARQRSDRWVAQPLQADGGQGGIDVAGREAAGQLHQPAQRQGQRVTYGQPLRHVAHRKRGGALDRPRVDVDQAQDGLRAGRLAGAVGADLQKALQHAHRTHAQHAIDHAGVVGHARHQVTGLYRVEVAQRQRVHLREHITPDVRQDPLPDAHHPPACHGVGSPARGEQPERDHHRQGDRAASLRQRPPAVQVGGDVVDGHLQHAWRVGGEHHLHDDQQRDARDRHAIAAQKVVESSQRAAPVAGLLQLGTDMHRSGAAGETPADDHRLATAA